jgi:hypothetical protein
MFEPDLDTPVNNKFDPWPLGEREAMSELERIREAYLDAKYGNEPPNAVEDFTKGWNSALAHERELLPCKHPKWALRPLGTEIYGQCAICAWCESLAHERQRWVRELKAMEAKVQSLVGCNCCAVDIGVGVQHEPTCGMIWPNVIADELAAFIKRLTEGK